MIYLESPSTDPRFNLALEQYVFDHMNRREEYFMLWQNHNTIVVGKHQNTAEEVNRTYVEQNGVQVVRRLSGGGAVYHDLGNLNFTFVVDAGDMDRLDFALFCRPVVGALASLGVAAQVNGRNDILIDGKKFSGNAQYIRKGRVMHHGTLLYNSDLSVVARALHVPADKIESKGVKSVRSRVTNILPHMPAPLPLTAFQAALKEQIFQAADTTAHPFTEADLAAVGRIQAERYDQWAWNYGASPPYNQQKRRRIEGCGAVSVYLDVQEGVIQSLRLQGDFFGSGEMAELEARLAGSALHREGLMGALDGLEVGHYIHNLSAGQLVDLLLH